jgi:hypothetical protein
VNKQHVRPADSYMGYGHVTVSQCVAYSRVGEWMVGSDGDLAEETQCGTSVGTNL